DAELQLAVVVASVFEDLDAAEQPPEVAEEDAARLAVVPLDAVHLDRRAKGLRTQVLRPRPHVRGAAEALLHAAAHIANHHRVEAGPCHDGEPLAVEAPDVELTAFAAETDRDRLLDVVRDAEVGGEQVGGAR